MSQTSHPPQSKNAQSGITVINGNTRSKARNFILNTNVIILCNKSIFQLKEESSIAPHSIKHVHFIRLFLPRRELIR